MHPFIACVVFNLFNSFTNCSNISFLQAFKETHDEIWLEYTVSCFLQGIKFGIPNSRSHLARVLYLLSFDTPNEPVGRAFDKYVDQIPHWVCGFLGFRNCYSPYKDLKPHMQTCSAKSCHRISTGKYLVHYLFLNSDSI